MIEIKINQCYKCPFRQDEFGICTLTKCDRDSDEGFFGYKYTPHDFTPKWCPLRMNDYIIKHESET